MLVLLAVTTFSVFKLVKICLEDTEPSLILSVKETVERVFVLHFDEYKNGLTKETQDQLANIAAHITKGSIVKVTGYTDHMGFDAYQKCLSNCRAQAVVGYFENKGIKVSKVDDKGKLNHIGCRTPIFSCFKDEHKVVITVTTLGMLIP